MMARKSKIDKDHEGVLYYRTNLLTVARALSFSKCLQANPNVRLAEVVRSPMARSEDKRWYVRWIPINPERHKALYVQMQLTRVIRAEQEEREMVFLPHDGRPGSYWCVHIRPDSIETPTPYEVDILSNECSCPDFTTRCLSLGIRCKHLILAQKEHERQEIAQQVVSTREKAERCHRVRANIAKDF